MIRVKIVGAGGYGGVGITELLLRHPEAEIVRLAASAEVGKRMSDLFPHLEGHCDLMVYPYDSPEGREPADVVFFSTPDGVGMQYARAELDAGAKVIDFSGDFRFDDPSVYAEYARRIGRDPVHASPELLPETVYGLAELRPERLDRSSRLVGNPGCFAVSVLLGLAPAVSAGLIEPTGIVCDCKTGVSGAGKKPSATFHFPARYDHMNAYKLAGHQHVMEIERELGKLRGGPVTVTFTAQVVPVCRGILSCLYGRLNPGVTLASVLEAYREFHRDHPFVRIYDRSASVGTAHVRGSNSCYLIVDTDERNGLLRVVSHIDNLMKGQAGSALQNMNILFGLPQTAGLDHPGQYP
ncbi:MAG: N-acetyl-gamma-glutamyl-phosphate reductase [Kiritimatiellia bacterium]|nr:N-acetyl-gamma-glutamyl-phosphate reductase [Kiritimatiellia bacterium]